MQGDRRRPDLKSYLFLRQYAPLARYNGDMCGRWATPYTRENIQRHYRVSAPLFRPSYNIAPGTVETVIVKNGGWKAEQMKWGLVPFWAKDPKIGYKMINARAESIADKPSFRKAFATQRCLIPAGGFYEWRHDGSRKIPYYIRLKNTKIFSLAGLFDTWKDPQGELLKTFTIVTTGANAVMKPIHDRMPVVLPEEYERVWLEEGDTEKLLALLRPYPHEDNMDAYPVTSKMNDPSYNEEDDIKPLQS